jgi:hypothetical protein
MLKISTENLLATVHVELMLARTKHPGVIASRHEAYSVILEELDEFWEEVKKQRPDDGAMLKELVQVAAMAVRAAEDLGIWYRQGGVIRVGGINVQRLGRNDY